MRGITVVASATFALALSAYAIAQAPSMPAAVKVANGIFTDAKGMTLYTFDNDKEANKYITRPEYRKPWLLPKIEDV